MQLITRDTPGVLDREGDLKGKHVILDIRGWAPRLHNPLLQLAVATGGNGCNPSAIGTGVFVQPLYDVGHRSYNLCAPGSDAGWKTDRYSILGIVDEKFVADLITSPSSVWSVGPGDPDDFCILGARGGEWVKRDSVADVLKALKVRTVSSVDWLGVVHREAGVNEFGQISTPWFADRKNRKTVTCLHKRVPATPTVSSLQREADAVLAGLHQSEPDGC